MMVNVGAFTGKTIIDPLRNVIGEQAYIYINYFSGAMTVIALLAVILLYKSTHTAGEGKSLREIGQGFMRIVTNWRLLVLILIVTGFWMVQQQLYATMPKYVIRLAGETAKPGWIANVNPFVVVCCVSFITRLMAKRSAITSMNVGMFLIPVSALLMACGNILGNDIISRNEQYYFDDGSRYRCAGPCRVFYFAAILGIFFFAGSQRGGRNVFRVQSSALVSFFHIRFQAGWYSADQILSGPCLV